ncbi:MAG: hypothetical protein RBR41_06720 [Desulfovibrio sp.]|uniref:hypothetical protein n=1 Tax=Desulfovibrio sp. TaxID=885 RepID=UPI002A36F35D|nr:hypothetical protein [Desulfovibrio sp.]MDY0259347.1 hypothetical protein [Desulfovibrio sp.]
MTMPYSPSRAVYEGNDAATRFPFSFKVWDASQLVVTLTSPDGATTEASGWTADIGASGGEIVYLHEAAPLPSGWKLAVTRNMPFTQEVNLVSASRFDPQVIEDALDQAAAERQQTLEMMRRSVILPATSDKSPQDMVLDLYAARDEAQSAGSAAQAAKTAAGQSAAQAAASAAGASAAIAAATATAVTAATAQADRAQSAANAAEAAAGAAADDARQAVAAEIGKASSEADRAQSEADRAQMEANRAQSLADVGPADADKLGFVKIGKGIAVTEEGTISVTPIDVATPEKAGIVKPGTGTTITGEGKLSVSYWDAFPPYVPIPVWGVKFGGSDGRRAIMPGETSAREDWILCDGGSDGKSGSMPGLQGRVLLGVDTSHSAGTLGGSASHSHTVSGSVDSTTISTAQMPSHGHYYTSTKNQNSIGSWGDAVYINNGVTGATTDAQGGNTGHTHSFSATSSATASYMPYCAINFVMKVA